MSFIDYFGLISDPRTDINVKHNLLDVIFLTITGVVSGCEGWKDLYEFGCAKIEWLRKYREFKNGIPVDDTIAPPCVRIVVGSLKNKKMGAGEWQ